MDVKDRLIAEILRFNSTTTREWLSQFGESDLRQYRDHLLIAQEPRSARSRWIRPSGASVVATRRYRQAA
jgi:hypothetical protein